MKSCIIIAIKYLEPEWKQTDWCIKSTGYDVHYVDRIPAGTGSLAEAINRGFSESNALEYEYAWIVTNIVFQETVLPRLIGCMNATRWAVIHPSFSSDHIHERTDGSGKVKIAPFVEFTGAIVRTDIFKDFPLDEDLPYWGHDLDHGYRMWQAGHKVGVDHGSIIGHVYLRNNKGMHPITLQRKQMRRDTDQQTREALQAKYGQQWRDIVFPKTPKQIGDFYNQVKEKMK